MNHELFEENSTIIGDILKERQRQNEKWGAHRHQHPFVWNTILMEEVGEACEDSLDMFYGLNPLESLSKYRKELVEVAAVTLAILQDLDINGVYKSRKD